MNPNHQTHAIASDGSLKPPVVEADGAGSTSEEVKAFQPIYRKVKEDLIHRVLKGEWKSGEMLPSEKELASSKMLAHDIRWPFTGYIEQYGRQIGFGGPNL